MNLLFEVYRQVAVHSEECIEKGKELDEAIDLVCEKYKNQLSSEEMENLREDVYSIAGKAEEHGFELGVKFIRKFIREIFLE